MTTTDIIPTPDLLQRSLAANAAFSLTSGLALAVGAPWLAGVLGPPTWVLALGGVGIAAFGAGIARLRRSHAVVVGRIALWADAAWVVAAAALGWLLPGALTSAGWWTLGVVTAVVAALAAAEAAGLRRAGR